MNYIKIDAIFICIEKYEWGIKRYQDIKYEEVSRY